VKRRDASTTFRASGQVGFRQGEDIRKGLWGSKLLTFRRPPGSPGNVLEHGAQECAFTSRRPRGGGKKNRPFGMSTSRLPHRCRAQAALADRPRHFCRRLCPGAAATTSTLANWRPDVADPWPTDRRDNRWTTTEALGLGGRRQRQQDGYTLPPPPYTRPKPSVVQSVGPEGMIDQPRDARADCQTTDYSMCWS